MKFYIFFNKRKIFILFLVFIFISDQSKVSDQNKLNKTPKSKVTSLKTPATDKANSSKEISRLEALCEARTKDLNYTKLQLKSSLAAFDAMAILVNYLANEVSIIKIYFISFNYKLEAILKLSFYMQ